MGIGKIGAFGKRALDAKYIGAQFGWADTNLFKFFVDGTVGNSEKVTTDLYLSTGTNVNNEYPRGFNVYGKHVSLYAPDLGKESADSSTHRIHIDSEQAIIGHENSYLRLSALSAADDTTDGKTKTSVLYLNNNFEFMNPKDRKTTMSTGDFTLSAIGTPKDDKTDKNGNYTYTIGGNLRLNATNSIRNIADKDFQIKAGEDYLMYSKAFSSVANNKDGTFTIGANNAKAVLTLNDNKGQNTTLVGEGLKFNAANNGISIVSDTSPNGIKLIATAIKDNEAQGGVSISLVPQSGGNGAFISGLVLVLFNLIIMKCHMSVNEHMLASVMALFQIGVCSQVRQIHNQLPHLLLNEIYVVSMAGIIVTNIAIIMLIHITAWVLIELQPRFQTIWDVFMIC